MSRHISLSLVTFCLWQCARVLLSPQGHFGEGLLLHVPNKSAKMQNMNTKQPPLLHLSHDHNCYTVSPLLATVLSTSFNGANALRAIIPCWHGSTTLHCPIHCPHCIICNSRKTREEVWFCIYLFKLLKPLLYTPPALTLSNSAFCPQSVFVCSVWFSQ
jgi:hypothetical protein